jgi:hypothetical protein
VTNVLATADLSNAPQHPILEEPHTYAILGFSYIADPSGALNGTLDLLLEKNGRPHTLRFLRAHELEIDAGFPHSYMGLEILDTTMLGWEHSRVRVQGFEDAPGIRFWAQSVDRVDA